MRRFYWMGIVLLAFYIAASSGYATEKPDLVLQTGHGAPTFWLEYLNDPNFIISSDLFSTKIWNINDCHCMKTIKGLTVASIDFTPDGRLVAASGQDGTRIFDAVNWRCIKKIKDFYGPVKLSPDGKTILASIDFGQMTVCDLETGKSNCLNGTCDIADRRVIWSSNGENIISGDGVWSRTGTQLCAFTPLYDGNWIAYTPEGYFDCSEGEKKYIGWTVGMKHYPFEQFYREYYTPGLFSRVMKGEKITKKID